MELRNQLIKIQEILWVYPYGTPINLEKGMDYRLRQLIDYLYDFSNFERMIILTPYNDTRKLNKKIDISSFGLISKYKIIKDFEKLMLSLNPKYLLKVVNFLRDKKKTKAIVYTSPLGSISAFFAKVVLSNSVILIYDCHNVERDRYHQEAVSEKEQQIIWWLKKQFHLEELILVKISDIIFTISHNDKRRLVDLYKIPPEKIVVIPPRVPNAHDVTSRRNKDGSVLLVFHGVWNYLPNREAAKILSEYIAPNLSKYKIVKIVIFGKDMPKIRGNNFEYVGFVNDLYSFLASCDLAVVPLKKGGGVKIKMLDYMAMGLPIVTTKKGSEGLSLVNKKHALIVDDTNEEFIKAIIYLIENPKIRRKLGYNVRKLAEKNIKEQAIWN